ncbi:hypothetical protein TRVA0_002S01596 [Trichomonascus vanleenenianus]|uniref:uncharacterized protein n=1 Tax=Trichomonascus vanleenenianus TaxID=2268995 RepID=UPI003ECAAA10
MVKRYHDDASYATIPSGNSSCEQLAEEYEVSSLAENEEEDIVLWKRSWFDVLMEGPRKPVEPRVSYLFGEDIQRLPTKLNEHLPKRTKQVLYWVLIGAWALLFYVLAKQSVLATDIRVDGEPAKLIHCGSSIYPVWAGRNDACGIDGRRCKHEIGEKMRFKCLADCVKESWTYSEASVGAYDSIYRPYVIGDGIYRADSSVCGAAAHAGVISNSMGGEVVIEFLGTQDRFNKSTGKYGIESIEFDSAFPESFQFVTTGANKDSKGTKDYRWLIIWLNVGISLVFGYFVTSAAGFYWAIVVCGFWTVCLASNPPVEGANGELDNALVIAELVSVSFRRFLPGMLGCFVIYKVAARPQLVNLDANLSRSVMWLSGFWIGILENYVFAYLPIDRLTVHDLNSQPGAWLTLVIVIGSILAIAVGQAFVIWRMGKFRPYITFYLGAIGLLAILAMIPNQTLRVHHYILALVLLPGTGFKTTPSLFYQGILVGLYVAGVSRWGFDSVIQTYDQLRRGAPSLLSGAPQFVPLDFKAGGQVIRWNGTGSVDMPGYSLVVNDVEQYRGTNASFSLAEWISAEGLAKVKKFYVRVAYAGEVVTGDYTRAGVIDLISSKWTNPKPGVV